MKTFFTADTHFHHFNIIKYCNRPFVDTVEMDNAIIDNWNSLVGKDDLVYHLGDFCFGKRDCEFDFYFNKLNGKICFIEGNHDSLAFKNKHKFFSYRNYHEIKINNQLIILCHYPMMTWRNKHHGSFMLHGHCHYNLPATRKDSNYGKILDVGVDGNNFKPYSFEEIKSILDKKPVDNPNPMFEDHHKNN
jgi:calcineurin-like phosphoesterase family protein